MPAGQLVPNDDFPKLRNFDNDASDGYCIKLVAFLPVKHFDTDNNSPFARRHAKRRIAHFPRFFPENSSKQPLFSRQFCFPFRRYFPN